MNGDAILYLPYKNFTITAWGEPCTGGRFQPRAEVNFRSGRPYGASFDEISCTHPSAEEAARHALGYCMNLIDDDDC